jgi:hypothetical protein
MAGSIPLGVSRVKADGPCTELMGDGMNTGIVIDGPDNSRDLGTLTSGSCFRVTELMVSNSGAGEFVDEAEVECQLGGDPYERWYKFKLESPLCVSVEVTFSNSMSDVDLLLFADFPADMPNPDYPQNIKIFRGSLNSTGVTERIRSVLLPAGSYHVAVSNFTGDSPVTDITTTIRASATGECTVFPARFENATTRDLGNINAIFCGVTDITGGLALADNFAVANRITPLSFPATLTAVQVLVFNRQQGNPISGKPFRLLVYTDPSGAGAGPSGDPVVNEQRNLGQAGILTTFQLTNPITIQQGDFYVATFFDGPHNGRGPVYYTQIPDARITYISQNGITNWRGPISFRTQAGETVIANAYIGGVFTSGGMPAAKTQVVKANRVHQVELPLTAEPVVPTLESTK